MLSCLLPDQGGLGGLAADVFSGSCLTCKDSVLVGWGGILKDDGISCPLLQAGSCGTSVNVQQCTVQLHPDSTYPKPAVLLRATERASVTATDCKLTGPAPGNSSGMDTAATADTRAAICLVGGAAHVYGVQPANSAQPLAFSNAGCAALCPSIPSADTVNAQRTRLLPAPIKQAFQKNVCVLAVHMQKCGLTPGLRRHRSQNQLCEMHCAQGHDAACDPAPTWH
jgi:hypothetical protein